jgi:predicted naringenin-chalcone synthase
MNVTDAQFSQLYSSLPSPSPAASDATALAEPPRRLPRPRISRLEIANAESSFSQEEVLALLGMRGDEFAERIFARCGVRRRQLSLSGDVLATTLQGRTTQIEDELFEYAVAAVERLEVDPLQIGTVVTATLYSLGGPTLAHRLVDHFRMAPDTDKYHVVGVGCASAVPLMRLAGQSLDHHPGRLGLVVAAESMTGILMGACADDAKAKVVGSAIFGDGCAAALLADDPGAGGPAILSAKVHQIAGTLDAVSLELAAEDSYLHLNRDLPEVAAAGLGELTESFLDSAGLDRAGIDHWMVHPGGRRIIDSVKSALSLSDEDVAVSRDVLANHGNIGTPSIFYVLRQTIEQRFPRPGDRGLMVTIGPGITVGLMLLQW